MTVTEKKSRRGAWRLGWRVGAALLAPALAVGVWAAYLRGTGNFHAVVPGEAYRSGQMNSNQLVRCIERNGIKSVINLRGANPRKDWWREEVAAAKAMGVEHRNVSLSSRRAVPPEKANQLLELYRELPKPVLIHCEGGADRAAFASALYVSEVARGSEAAAVREFSIWYGYMPFIWKRKAQLRESFQEFVHHQRLQEEAVVSARPATALPVEVR